MMEVNELALHFALYFLYSVVYITFIAYLHTLIKVYWALLDLIFVGFFLTLNIQNVLSFIFVFVVFSHTHKRNRKIKKLI